MNVFLPRGRADAHILGRPLAYTLKLITLLAATLVWLNNSGVEISALLAGLGIGGVALALALQKPIDELDFSNYLAVVGELNLSIIKIVQDAGAHFAQGAGTVMLEYGNNPAPGSAVP